MMIPFYYGYGPTEKERYERKVQDSLKKAKHLSERVTMFIQDIDKAKFKDNDRNKIKALLKEELSKLDLL